jgi:hypothetical protein
MTDAATEALCVVVKRTSGKSAKVVKKQAGQLPGERM